MIDVRNKVCWSWHCFDWNPLLWHLWFFSYYVIMLHLLQGISCTQLGDCMAFIYLQLETKRFRIDCQSANEILCFWSNQWRCKTHICWDQGLSQDFKTARPTQRRFQNDLSNLFWESVFMPPTATFANLEVILWPGSPRKKWKRTWSTPMITHYL